MINFPTINENRDFRKIYRRGKSFVSPELVTYVLKNKSGVCRYGITVAKKTGNAVLRNRSKRIIRAALYQLSDDISCGCDLIFVARTKTSSLKSTDIACVMQEHLRLSGIMRG